MQNLYQLIYRKALKLPSALNLLEIKKYYNNLINNIRTLHRERSTRAVLLFCLLFYFLFLTLFVQSTYCDPVSIEMERINNSIQGIFQKRNRAGRVVSKDYKCATPIIHYALKHREFLWPENRFILHRPDNPSFSRYYSPNGLLDLTYDTQHFKIHYTTAGDNAVFNSDPNYAIKFGDYFEEAWKHEINILGYNPPRSDGTNGGDNRFDVYIKAITYYGYTSIENGHPYIVVNNDYTDEYFRENSDPNGQQAGSMKVTAAHEFFHAIQFFYDDWCDGCLWWEENTAVWMEDEVFDYVDDYLHYIPKRLQNMEFPLDYLGNKSLPNYEYGGVIWAKFLSETYGMDIIRHTFERFLIDASVANDAIEYTLYDYNSNWGEAMTRFCLKNLKMDYEEGDGYLDSLNIDTFTDIIHNQIYTTDIEKGYFELGLKTSHLSCKYFKFVSGTQIENIKINLTSQGTVPPLAIFVPDKNSTGNPEWDSNFTGMEFILNEFGNSSTYPRAYLIVINPNPDNDNCQYYLTTDINTPALQTPVINYPVSGQVITSRNDYPSYDITLCVKNITKDSLYPDRELEYVFELYKNSYFNLVDSQTIPEGYDNPDGTTSCKIYLNDQTGGLYYWRCQARVANSTERSLWTPLSDFYYRIIFENDTGCFISALP